MSMKEDCQTEIYKWASGIRQMNAALSGEFRDYVNVTLTLLRDNYHDLIERGETEWSVPDHIIEYLTENKPYDF